MFKKLKRKEEIYFRKKPKRLKFWLWFGGIVLFLGGLIVAVYFFIHSDFFKVRSFEVGGTDLVSRDDLLLQAAAQAARDAKWLSFLGLDRNNLLFWRFSKKPILGAGVLPMLAEWNSRTDFSQKKVIIQAKEKEFVGVWCFVFGGECYGFDRDGVLFMAVPELKGSLILKIEDQNSRSLKLGEPVLEKTTWFKNLLSAVETIKANGLPVSVVKIKNLALQEWEAEIYPGVFFYFSLNFSPENLDVILKNLVKQLDFKKLTYLDFRVANRVYYK